VLVFTFRSGDDGTTRAETTAKGHQFTHPDDNLLVEELAGPLGLSILISMFRL
jgi:hypothetical protein